MSDWTIILRSLGARAFSTATTIVTVAVAVGLMMTLLMLRHAGKQAFERGAGDMHLIVSRDASPLVSILNGIFYAGAPRNPILWREFERISKERPYEYAIPAQIGDSYRGIHPVLATTTDFFTKFKPDGRKNWTLRQGRFFEKNLEVVVGAQAAKFTGLKIGDTLVLTHGIARRGSLKDTAHVHEQFKYTVVGILKPSGTGHDRALFTDLTSSWLSHAFDRRERDEHKAQPGTAPTTTTDDHDHAHDDHDHDHAHDEPPITPADLTDADKMITNIYLRVPGGDASPFLPQTFDALRRDTSITVASPRQEIDKLFLIVSNIDQIFVGLAVVVMLSSGIGIMLALYESMAQRRRQIAVLRVLGASQSRIFGLVMTESAIIGIIGSICGVLGGIVGAMVVAGVMKQRLGLTIMPILTADALIGVMLGTIVLSLLAGLIPAMMAYRTSVAKNLRPLG